MPTADRISLDHAKPDKLFYVVANVVIFRASDQRCLVLKRSETEKVHPGKFGVTGGKLEWSDLDPGQPSRINGDVLDYQAAIEALLQRETREEAGIEITGPYHFINDVAYIRPDGIPVIMIKFAALYQSGEVQLEEDSFADFAWVNAAEVAQLPCIEGIPQEVAQTISIFSSDDP